MFLLRRNVDRLTEVWKRMEKISWVNKVIDKKVRNTIMRKYI